MLVTTIEQVQKHFTTVVGMNDFELFQTYLEDAERWLKREVLGSDLYNRINNAPDDETNAPLVDFCQKVICLKGGHIAIPFLDLIMTNNGFAVASNKNVAPASKDRVNRLLDSVLKRYYDQLEELFIYLEETSAFHTEWKSSTAYLLAFDHIINAAEEFNQYVFIDNSRLVFSKLLPTFNNIESLGLPQFISKAFVDEIITQQKDEELSPANLLILDNLKAAAANYVMAKGIEPLSAVIDEKGISRAYIIGKQSFANEDRLLLLKNHFTKLASDYIGEVVKVLDKTPDNYPTYRDSSVYQAKLAAYTGYQNSKDSSIFVGA